MYLFKQSVFYCSPSIVCYHNHDFCVFDFRLMSGANYQRKKERIHTFDTLHCCSLISTSFQSSSTSNQPMGSSSLVSGILVLECVFVCECNTRDSVWGTEADNSERSIDAQKHSQWIYSHLGHVHMWKGQNTLSHALGKTMHSHVIIHTSCSLSHTPKQAPLKLNVINLLWATMLY